jgi:hypothetical protein
MNRFQNNKYLDRAGFITGTVGASNGMVETPPQLRALASDTPSAPTTAFRYHYKLGRPKDYADVAFTYDGLSYWGDPENQNRFPTVPGEYLVTQEIIDGETVEVATLITEQKAEITGTDTIFEAESQAWYTHRPEEILYPTDGHEAIFLRTNEYRTLFFAPRVTRQLRGDGNPAEIAVAECAASGDLSHNSLNFRPGFRTADGKVLNAIGVDEASGENLAAGFTGTTADVGDDVALAWRQSPGHFANMLSTAWDNDATIPGAQHSIGYVEGTITEQSEDIPDINTYPGGAVTGGIWSQVFHKRKEWATAWHHTFEGEYGVVGWDGLAGPQDNTPLATLDPNTQAVLPFRAYFGFRGCRYVLPNSADEEKSIRVLGVAVYAKDVTVGEETTQELWFRVALLLNDIGEDFQNATAQEYGDGKIQIFTAPVGVTEANYKDRYGYYDPDPEREWELEGEFECPLAIQGDGEGWLYPAFATAAISPDGRKFCFTYQKYKIDTQPLLHRSSTDFGQSTNRDVMVAWFVHLEKEVGEDFVVHNKPPPTATVTAAQTINTPNNYRNNYTRALSATYDFMPYYTAVNELAYVQLSVDEYQTQAYSGYMWRVRKLLFASGKEVLIDYQALDNFLTPDFASFQIEHPAFSREEGVTSPFNSVILYLDPKTEDVILSKNICPNSLVLGAENVLRYEATTELAVDLGYGDDRIQEVLCRRDHDAEDLNMQTFTAAAALVSAGDVTPFVSGEFVLDTRFSFMVYNYKSPSAYLLGPYNADTQYEVETVIGGTWPDDAGWYVLAVQNRQIQWFANWDGTGGTDQYDPASYGTYDIEGMYNAADHEVSVWQPPHQYYAPGKENLMQERDLFANQIAASLYTCNIAPAFTDFKYLTPQVARYNGRVLLRIAQTHLVGRLYASGSSGYIGPYASSSAASTATHYPDRYEDAETVSSNTRINNGVLLWSNFDLDAAAEISDVTDIQPFGRAV